MDTLVRDIQLLHRQLITCRDAGADPRFGTLRVELAKFVADWEVNGPSPHDAVSQKVPAVSVRHAPSERDGTAWRKAERRRMAHLVISTATLLLVITLMM